MKKYARPSVATITNDAATPRDLALSGSVGPPPPPPPVSMVG